MARTPWRGSRPGHMNQKHCTPRRTPFHICHLMTLFCDTACTLRLKKKSSGQFRVVTQLRQLACDLWQPTEFNLDLLGYKMALRLVFSEDFGIILSFSVLWMTHIYLNQPGMDAIVPQIFNCTQPQEKENRIIQGIVLRKDEALSLCESLRLLE